MVQNEKKKEKNSRNEIRVGEVFNTDPLLLSTLFLHP